MREEKETVRVFAAPSVEKSPFVPDGEQLYPLPENWRWVSLGTVGDIKRGASPRPIKDYITENPDGINWIKIGDTNEGKYITSVKQRITKEGSKHSVYVSKGTLLLSNSMSFGTPYILNISGCIHDGWLAITPAREVDKEFLYYSLLASRWYFEKVAVGITVRNLNSDRVARTPVVLPPLPEQRRIVERIESMFTKLDEARDRAQAVLNGYEYRRAAILYQAFTGELTAKWRARHGISIQAWQTQTLQSVCSMKITDGTHQTPTYCSKEEGFPFLSSKDVTKGVIRWDNLKYIPPALHEKLYSRLSPQRDDILLAKNGTTGVAAIVDTDRVFDIYVTLAVLRPNQSIINPQYLLNIVNSPLCKRQFDEHLTGITLPNLHLRDIKAVEIMVPSLREQTEIVRALECALQKEQAAKSAAERVLESVDLMKKAILGRAFQGLLGTNNLREPCAEIPL